MEDKAPNIIYLGFADNKVPEFKEVRSKDWVLFGEKNDFPDHLLYLYNKSSNHGAIVNGKVKYIIGKGVNTDGTRLDKVNRRGESFNKLLKRSCTDIEIFGGFYWEIVWNQIGSGFEIFHMPFNHLRRGKGENGWWYKKDWKSYKQDAVFIPDFNDQQRTGKQIFAYREYRAGTDVYPLPGYMAALNDIETDVEISKYNLSVIKNGMFSSKMITFRTGDPGEEGKKKLEKGMVSKFNGSENAGNSLLVFINKGEDPPTVEDLSTTDLDKLFDQLNKTTQSEIFTGHEVTSPMLFGVKTEGQLGGRDEIANSYEIFKNTYVNAKQQELEEAIEWIYPYFGVNEELKFEPVSPVGIAVADSELYKHMSPDEIREFAGLPPLEKPQTTEADKITQAINSLSPLVANKVLESMSENEIRSLIGLSPKAGGDAQPQQIDPATGQPTGEQMVNENVKNMTGRQFQNLNRVITKYKNGKLDKAAAVLLLKNSFGLGDDDIETLLNPSAEFSKEYTEEEVVEMFESIGESKQQFSIVKSKPYRFEEHHEEFADLKKTDSSIVDLIKKDRNITPEVIAATLNEKTEYVNARIKALEKSGVLTQTSKTIGVDTIIERTVNPEVIDTRARPETVDVYIKYSYEAKDGLEPIIETTRPFCRKLIQMDKLYTRAEIESISQRVGFSVWDRKGGFWGDKDECRHRWVKHIVIKKK